MTRREQQAKQEILKILLEEGYKTYSKLFDMFDLNLTKDPNVVGYMEPAKARIVVNENLSIDQVSFVVRHEILHEYLDHQLRMQQHMGDDNYNKRSPAIHQLINMAADWEISNRGYTDKDKRTAKNIRLGDQVVQGLVTDIDHPDWVKLSLEEMFDKLMDEYNKNQKEMEDMLQQMAKAGLDIGSGTGSAQQEMEDIERKAEEKAEAAAEAGDKEEEKKQKEISQAAGKAADDAKDQEDKDAKDGSVFKDEEDQKAAEELAKRVEAIKKAFKEASKGKDIEKDDYEASEKADMAKAAKEITRYNESPLQKFKISLNQLIRSEIATGRGATWTRFNKKYTNTGLIKPGSSRLRQNKVPLIDIYYDVSGSVQPYIKTTHQVLTFINEYVRKGQIKVNVYYVSTKISNNEKDSTGGGADGYLIMDNIAKTKPDNVIILTDRDANGSFDPISVPGGVYFLFPNANSIPDGLVEALRGKRLTQTFYI